MASQPQIPLLTWTNSIQGEARDFITQCTAREPARRPSATELLAHRWFRDRSDLPEEPSVTSMNRRIELQRPAAEAPVVALDEPLDKRAVNPLSAPSSHGITGMEAT